MTFRAVRSGAPTPAVWRRAERPLVLDAVVEAGYSPDSTRCLPMSERHSEIYATGCRRSRWRATAAVPARRTWHRRRPWGCTTWSPTMKKGLRSPRTWRRHRRSTGIQEIPAGMEAVVSYFKLCFGLHRCNWRGLELGDRTPQDISLSTSLFPPVSLSTAVSFHRPFQRLSTGCLNPEALGPHVVQPPHHDPAKMVASSLPTCSGIEWPAPKAPNE